MAKKKRASNHQGRKSIRRKELEKDLPAFYRLTDMQKKFVMALVDNDFDRVRAVELSGSKASTHTSKTTQAHNWLLNPDVNEAVDDEIKRRADELRINKDRVVQEIAKIAFANAEDFFEWSNNSVIIKDSSRISRDRKAAIKSIKSKSKTHYDRNGNPIETSEMELTLHDKLKALDLLGRHIGIFKDQLTLEAGKDRPFTFKIEWGEDGDGDA